MNAEFKATDNPRVIAIQKIYGKFYNKEEDLIITKHRFKKFIKDVVIGTIERNDLIIDELKNHLSEDLNLSKLDKLFQVIIKCAVFELLYKPNTSSRIIIKEYLNASNFFIEDSQTKYLNALLDKISKKIRISGGGILIIDYGNFDKTMKNTLQSISNHKYNNVLNNFGQSDITYSINFRLIEKIVKKLSLKVSGVTNQKNFLTNLGILKRAEIISKNLPFSKKTDIYFRVKRLVDKNLMGELFKVMLITRQNTKFQTGFKN